MKLCLCRGLMTAILVSTAFAACSTSHVASPPPAGDADAAPRDAAVDAGDELDANTDGGPRRDDGGEAGVPDVCPTTYVSGGVCGYSGYGTVCNIPCDFPPTCTYNLLVAWSGGGYCCGSVENSYRNCRCEGGQTICEAYPEPGPPTATCEFCGPGLGIEDAGPGDTADLGSDCPSRPLGHDCMASGYAGACEVWSCVYPERDGGVLCYVGTACTSDADCTCPGPCVRGVCR